MGVRHHRIRCPSWLDYALEPFEYLSEVFEQLPLATTVEAIEALLPWNLKPVLDARRKRQESAPR